MRANYGPLAVSLDGGVAVVTIDHPPHNLVNGPLITALGELLDDLEPPGAPARVVVFRSADPDFFLMHGDVERLSEVPASRYVPLPEPNLAARTFERLTTGPLVTVGVIDGAARGGGAEFLSACDIRFGSPRAVIGQPEVPMGILPGAGGTVRLARLLGRSRALEVILTGRDVTAEEALAIGWLTILMPAAELEAGALAFARQVAAMPAASVRAVKRVVNAALDRVNVRGGPHGAPLDAADTAPYTSDTPPESTGLPPASTGLPPESARLPSEGTGLAPDALTTESNALAELMAAGAHIAPMRRFLAAGGQTREQELNPQFWKTWWAAP